jgi:hypothetical protein
MPTEKLAAPLSEAEEKLYKILSRRPKKKFSSTELVDLYWDSTPPFNARAIIHQRMAVLARKTKRIRKSERRGPHPISFWVE